MSLPLCWHQIARWPYRLRSHFLRQALGQQVAAGVGRELTPRCWIFIIGCYNSGTTLLKDMLAQHPAIGVLPGEGVRFTDALPRPETLGWNRMWCCCAAAMRLGDGPEFVSIAARIKRQWSLLFPRRPFLLEKSIANAARLPFLNAHFRPASFVYLVRNGYAVAEGIRRKARPGRWGNPEFAERYPISLCARQWRDTERLVGMDRIRVERFFSLSYEELTATPQTALARITRFLELEPLAPAVFDQAWVVHGRASVIRNMNPESLARLSPADVDAIQSVAGSELAAGGYTRPEL